MFLAFARIAYKSIGEAHETNVCEQSNSDIHTFFMFIVLEGKK